MEDNKKPSNPRMHNPDGQYASEARNEDCFELRDYFAAKAMQGLLSKNGLLNPIKDLGEASYQVADTMLKERENQ